MILKGKIKNNGTVETPDGRVFQLPVRGTDEKGYPEVLIDSSVVDELGGFKRKSILPYIGMEVEFTTNDGTSGGYNFTIIADK